MSNQSTKRAKDRIVNISSIGAGTAPNLGTVSFCGTVESIFNQTVANVLHLRPGYFMENFLLEQVEFIRHDRIISFPFPSDHDMPWISIDDIGDAAAIPIFPMKKLGLASAHIRHPIY